MSAGSEIRSWATLAGVAACSSVATVLIASGCVSAAAEWCLCRGRQFFSKPSLAPECESCCDCACHLRGAQASPSTPPKGLADNGQSHCQQPAGGKRLDAFDPRPRPNYMPWEDYFMAVAHLSAQRSKDPNKQVGACIVSHEKVILGIGYNGFPRGCPDDKLPWAKKSATGDQLETKYPYVCHAEMNAIMNKNAASLQGAKMYVTMFPCNECAKLIIQAGISEVVFQEAKVSSSGPGSPSSASTAQPDPCYKASMRLLELAGVTCRQLRMKHSVTVTAL